MPTEDDNKRNRRPGLSDAMRRYDANIDQLFAVYEAFSPEAVHSWLKPLLPKVPATILDVGSGTGRDAAWLSKLGYDVVAVEPTASMRERAQQTHASVLVRWLDDRLPGLEEVHRLGLSFDLILLSAVWMHVAPVDRTRAFRKLITLLKPGGCIALTLRHGQVDQRTGFFAVSQAEIEQLARNHGAFIEWSGAGEDLQGRSEVRWTQIVVRLPDDGTGALPLLRHVILNDDKASTYKLALLRVLCRIADGAAGFGREAHDDHIAVPLGLVGLYWLRLFMPLLKADLPQSPQNRGLERLGFVGSAFRQLAELSPLDLRIGVQFSSRRSTALHQALKDACRTVCEMPAHFMTFPSGKPVLPVRRVGRMPRPAVIRLDHAYLASFGEMFIPGHLWKAIQRFDIWIEPALFAEWSRLMRNYALGQGRDLDEAIIASAMRWSDPSRDVRLAKEQANELLESRKLFCVWSGRALSPSTLDIDHCFPWAFWPCEDLWNLLPTHRRVNQNEKRDKLPSITLLRGAKERILEWWQLAYLTGRRAPRQRFYIEAKASLPIASNEALEPDALFDGLELLQIRLKTNQQIPVWQPSSSTSSAGDVVA